MAALKDTINSAQKLLSKKDDLFEDYLTKRRLETNNYADKALSFFGFDHKSRKGKIAAAKAAIQFSNKQITANDFLKHKKALMEGTLGEISKDLITETLTNENDLSYIPQEPSAPLDQAEQSELHSESPPRYGDIDKPENLPKNLNAMKVNVITKFVFRFEEFVNKKFSNYFFKSTNGSQSQAFQQTNENNTVIPRAL